MAGWSEYPQSGSLNAPGTAIIPYVEQAAPPPLPKGRRIRLGSIREIRKELSAVYREARLGKLDTAVATRYTYMLRELAAMIRDNELEARVEALEAGTGK